MKVKIFQKRRREKRPFFSIIKEILEIDKKKFFERRRKLVFLCSNRKSSIDDVTQRKSFQIEIKRRTNMQNLTFPVSILLRCFSFINHLETSIFFLFSNTKTTGIEREKKKTFSQVCHWLNRKIFDHSVFL